MYPGIFNGCIGVGDVKEYQVVKYKDPVKERRSWSGKKKINSYKLLSVMDHSGRYIFARLCLGGNDRDIFTGSPLYLHEGDFFVMTNLLQQMVHLRVMEGFVALIRILGMMKLRNCLMLHGVNLELE